MKVTLWFADQKRGRRTKTEIYCSPPSTYSLRHETPRCLVPPTPKKRLKTASTPGKTPTGLPFGAVDDPHHMTATQRYIAVAGSALTIIIYVTYETVGAAVIVAAITVFFWYQARGDGD